MVLLEKLVDVEHENNPDSFVVFWVILNDSESREYGSVVSTEKVTQKIEGVHEIVQFTRV